MNMPNPPPRPHPIPRRSFLKGTVAASAAAAALPSLFARAVWAQGAGDAERVLVLVQLDGGNDGLNTVIPYADDLYRKARPGIGIAEAQVVKLDGHVGLHPNLDKLRAVWDGGGLAALQGIGYPNPNRSHFTSTDIWHTASVTPPARWNGWVGRSLDCCAQGDVPGLQLDGGPLSLALVGERVVVPSISDASRFQVRGGDRAKELLRTLAARTRDGATLEHMRRSASQSYTTSERIERALAGGKGADAYPPSDLARRLWQIARMVEARTPARVYAVRLGGFDTHSRQRAAHDQLMRTLGDALGAFHGDLRAAGLLDRVLVLTYSEFGRRVGENRSLGTDHGAAAPMLALGGPVRGGVHGAHPSLSDLDDGDLKFHTDFRQVYATVLGRWLGVEPAQVLGGSYAQVPFL